MNRKILKLIKCIVIVFIITSFLCSIIVSLDEHHIETCHDDNCGYCQIIHIAQCIIMFSTGYIMVISLKILIQIYLARLHKEKIIFVQSSLVFQKVQLNE